MNDFTLLITVFNRQNYIPKLIEYYKGVNIIFVDSSQIPYKYPNGVRHIICSGNLLYESLREGAIYANTKYICWNNDDDLILKPFLKAGVKFINVNKSYSSVMGCQIKQNTIYGTSEFLAWYENQYYSEDVYERIKQMMLYFHTPAHAIMKTECLVDACNIPISDNSLYPIRFFDRILGIVQACHGNKKVLPYVSLHRGEDRMIMRPNYPKKLQKDTRPNQLLQHFGSENSLTYYLKNNYELNDEQITSISFRRAIKDYNISSKNFKVNHVKFSSVINEK